MSEIKCPECGKFFKFLGEKKVSKSARVGLRVDSVEKKPDWKLS